MFGFDGTRRVLSLLMKIFTVNLDFHSPGLGKLEALCPSLPCLLCSDEKLVFSWLFMHSHCH